MSRRTRRPGRVPNPGCLPPSTTPNCCSSRQPPICSSDQAAARAGDRARTGALRRRLPCRKRLCGLERSDRDAVRRGPITIGPRSSCRAWLAGSLGTTLRLVGNRSRSRLGAPRRQSALARASIFVQQVVGIVTEPVLVPPGEDGVLEASRDARLLVVGLSSSGEPKASARPTRGRRGRPRTHALRTPRPPARRRRSQRDADPLHLDARIALAPSVSNGRSSLPSQV